MSHPVTSPFWGHLTGIVTVVLMLIFIGIWVWAWRKRHRSTFRRMSELPMQDKPEGPVPGQQPRAGRQENEKGGQP